VSRRAGAADAVTSDLTIDEVLLLHTLNWEPVDMVCGAAVFSIPQGSWTWGTGEITPASSAHGLAIDGAAQRIRQECRSAGGHGVIGVDIEVTVESHHVTAVLVGTAVRPVGGAQPHREPFVSDLSTRDFALLQTAGWEPVGLAFGASFVHVPRRSAGQTLKQQGQNVELTNFTAALYDARESAMERMQAEAIRYGAKGVVDVSISEGPMHFARHAIRFTAWGTAVVPGPSGHQYVRPRVVLATDDPSPAFEAAALRGE
jgi:uncharacterized protein YbjQ (UPF0145 family)